MREQLREGIPVLHWGGGLIQVGTTAPHSFTLTGVAPAEEAWLRSITAGRLLPKRATLSAAQARIADLLRSHQLLEQPVENPLAEVRLRVVGLDRVGVMVARLLAASGARYLDLRDGGLVDRHVNRLFGRSCEGLGRKDCLQRELADGGVAGGKSPTPALVISVENQAIDHQRGAHLLSRDVPHLPIVVMDRLIQVGPLLVPGVTACYLCLDFHRQDELPGWAQVREQLRSVPAAPPDYSLAATAAGLATNLVEQVFTPPGNAENSPAAASLLGQSWLVGAEEIRQASWFAHPSCACDTARLFS